MYENDKKFLDAYLEAIEGAYVNTLGMKISGQTVFMYPLGLCTNFVNYNASKGFTLSFRIMQNYAYENMFVFISDPGMLTHSSIDQLSHQGVKFFGVKKGHNTIYDVEAVIKDRDNPSERDSCSLSSYADCVDQQTKDIFFQVSQ